MDYLTDWHPHQDFRNLREQMDRFFKRMPYENFLDLNPSVDVFERDNQIIIQAEIPGIDPDNIEIGVSEEMVNIRGRLEKSEEINEEHYHRVERKFGTFNRTINLPTRVDHKKAQADTTNGVLEIIVPKLTVENDQTTHLKIDKRNI